MGRELQHSAEGTHWTKKNHKYIRKEGNRYIYADDANKLRRTQAMNRQGTADYRSIGTDRAKRSQASNGVGAKNQEYAKAQSSLQRTKQLYKSTGGKAPNEYKVGGMTLKRATPAIPDTSVEKAKAITQQRNKAANGNGARNQQYAKAQTARQVMNRQGSGVNQPYAKAQAGTTSIRARRKNSMYDQGTGFIPNAKGRIYEGKGGTSHVTIDQGKYESDWHKGVMDYNSDRGSWKRERNRNFVSNASKKQKSQGYFTLKNGETEFVPSDKIVMRRLNAGEKFVDNLKSKLGEISAKKDQLAKKAKDFFHKLGAKYEEARYLKPQYDENSGRPKSNSKYERITNDDSNAKLGSTTGNAGGGNLRVGVEAGRRRAGVKKSGNVQGLENNLRNKGYNASTDANWENNMDNFNGSYSKKDLYRLDGNSYNDWHATRQKHDNEAVRQNLDRHNSRLNDRPDELTRGTKAGQQRVNRKKAANGNGAKNQQYAKANPGIEALKYGKAPTPYTDKERTSVDVSKYKDMKFTDKELSKIRKIDSDLRKLHERRDQEAIDKYYDNLSDRDTALYFSYNRKDISNSPKVTGVSLSGSSNSNKSRKKK